jgi:parallel beta-helix repeat protein
MFTMRIARLIVCISFVALAWVAAAAPVTPGDYGALGNGVADDSSAVQAALSTGRIIHLVGGTYRITQRLDVPANGGIVGPGTIVHDFNLSLPPDDPISLDAALWVGGDDVQLSDFTIRKVFTDGSYSSGIVVDHRAGALIRNVEISGYSARYGIHLIECSDFEVSGCYIHDFMMNTTADMIQDSPAGLRVTRSHRGVIAGNRVFRIEAGPIGRASISPIVPSYGPQRYQSDNMTLTQCSGIAVTGNVCVTSGEGIDMLLSTACTLSGNVISDTWFLAVKMLGSSFCSVTGNYITDSYMGIYLGYHPVQLVEASGNTISGNVILDIGAPGSFGTPPDRTWGVRTGVDIHDASGNRYNVITDNMIADTQAIKTMVMGVNNNGGPTNLITDNIYTTEMALD